MKSDIHPKCKEIEVICSCGNSLKVSSALSKDVLNIEMCSSCHPFYTGKQKIVDTAGRVEKFQKKYSDTKASTKKK
jgi:large subunit ribosomal protein L31